jgi:hypothetical protein
MRGIMQTTGRKTRFGKFILIGLVLGVSALIGVLVVHAAGLIGTIIAEEANGARREIEVASPPAPLPRTQGGSQGRGETQQPTISFIDSPSATCDQPVSGRNDCYITWNYLYVTASSSQYIISMTVDIANHPAAYHSGFFQTSMYIPGDIFGQGFKVVCGPRNVIGLGNTYAYTIRARETGGLSAANYGSVQCPGMYVNFLPAIRR